MTFSRSLADWNESLTVKAQGHPVGEYQIHHNRNCIKFRFKTAALFHRTPPFRLNYLGSKRRYLEMALTRVSRQGDVFADLFSGTGVVGWLASEMGLYAKIITYASIISRALLLGNTREETQLVDPETGPITRLYATERRYFTPENARLIDGYRSSDTSQCGGSGREYGFSLWGLSSALKPLDLRRPIFRGSRSEIEAEADVVYLDPPYNRRDYGANYHVLETLARGDTPEVKGVTGLPKSRWCTQDGAKTALKEIVAALRRSRVIVLSYSDQGLLALSDIREAFAGRTVALESFTHQDYAANEKKRHVEEYLIVAELSP